MYADWEPVVLRKRTTAPGAKTTSVARAVKSGAEVVTVAKTTAASNKSSASAGAGISARALEEDDEHYAHATVGHSMSLAIQRARMDKKMTQKALSVLICEKATVVADYEAGRAVPNPAIISKLERALGVHLPRPAKKK